MARCEQLKKRRYMSNNWTYSSLLCFFKKLPQFFLSGSSLRIMGIHTTVPAVETHISPKMARVLIAIYRTMYRLWFLVYERGLLQLHFRLLLHHLHHRIPYLMSTDTPKIQYQKEVEVRVKSFGETRCMIPQKPKTKIKMRSPKKYKEISHELPDWLQDFRENLVDESTSTDPWGNPDENYKCFLQKTYWYSHAQSGNFR